MANSKSNRGTTREIPVSSPGAVIHEPAGNFGGTERGGHVGMNEVPGPLMQPTQAGEAPASRGAFPRPAVIFLVAAGALALVIPISWLVARKLRARSSRGVAQPGEAQAGAAAGDELVVTEVYNVRGSSA